MLRQPAAVSLHCGARSDLGKAAMDLYTKFGRPLQVSKDTIYSRSGRVVGRIYSNRVYGTNGRYVGTIVGDRLVYRATDRAAIKPMFSAANKGASGKGNRCVSAVWGDEPDIPD